ncbi:diguanylate cyclase domain-containing protein [Amphibacillus indicireducens]|uniref:GGDEF domain-containing protein n=1 Tax=Amphibacillus indicireducens TaxID=1076330 RepID=A0ABP7VRN2_9BACI
MESYTLTDNHDLFIYDPKQYYRNSDWLYSIVKQVRLRLNIHSVALYMFDSWADQYTCVQSISEQAVKLPEQLPNTIINKVNKYKRLSHKLIQELDEDNVFERISIASIDDEDGTIGYFLFFAEDKDDLSHDQKNQVIQTVEDMSIIIMELRRARYSIAQANKYENMFNITQKFHSSMNPRDVLAEITEIIYSIYPNFNCELYLSKNYQEDLSLPIKEFIYNEKYADQASAQAFLTGKLKIEATDDSITLYAPFNGKQGVYGVMQLRSTEINYIPNSEVEFIRILANTAGNALENAQLYQQSNLLIQDLQLINTFAHELNKLDCITSITKFIKKQFQTSFNAGEIGFVLINDVGKYEVEAESTRLFHAEKNREDVHFLLDQVKKEKEAIFISDLQKQFEGIGLPYQSVILLPMIQTDQLIGIIVVLHPEAYYFTFDQYKLMISLVQHSTLAFDNIILREKLEQSVITDYLTKLYSREYLDEKCLEHLEKDQRGIFLLLDLDDFKLINDSFGHDVGDTVLIQVSNIIRREIDGKGFAARWGGEELAVYLPEANAQMGRVFANKLLTLIEHSTKPRVTASIGLASWDNYLKLTLDELLDQADQALYKAKRLGKNQYQIITSI